MMRLVESFTRTPATVRPEVPTLDISPLDGGLREDVQRYIAGVFQISYGAQVQDFMPLLVSLREQGHLTAALGLRGAASGQLFCEQYLDEPVETHVQRVFGRQVQRGRILEMGSLVASNPGHAALLYTLVGAAMYEAAEDLCCTGISNFSVLLAMYIFSSSQSPSFTFFIPFPLSLFPFFPLSLFHTFTLSLLPSFTFPLTFFLFHSFPLSLFPAFTLSLFHCFHSFTVFLLPFPLHWRLVLD